MQVPGFDAAAASASRPRLGSAKELVDLERYPLDDLGSPRGMALLALCREQLATMGVVMLPDFVTDAALRTMTTEAARVAPLAYRSDVVGNPYLEPVAAGFPDDHPQSMVERTTLGAVAYDEIPEDFALRRLYEWDQMLVFLAAALGQPAIFRYADTLGALNLAVMLQDDYLRWHFDQTDFVVSLALQEAEAGGDFEYVPMIRGEGRENFPKVRQVLLGDAASVHRLPVTPGALILFAGRHSLHRVTPIRGERPRLMALLGYDTRPGVVSSEHLRYMRYGRS